MGDGPGSAIVGSVEPASGCGSSTVVAGRLAENEAGASTSVVNVNVQQQQHVRKTLDFASEEREGIIHEGTHTDSRVLDTDHDGNAGKSSSDANLEQINKYLEQDRLGATANIDIDNTADVVAGSSVLEVWSSADNNFEPSVAISSVSAIKESEREPSVAIPSISAVKEPEREANEDTTRTTAARAAPDNVRRQALFASSSDSDGESECDNSVESDERSHGMVSDQGEFESSSDESESSTDDSKPRFMRASRKSGKKKNEWKGDKEQKREAKKKRKKKEHPKRPSAKETEKVETSEVVAESKIPAESEKKPLYCNICAYSESLATEETRFQCCRRCGVVVHESCYGIAPYMGSSWECHACAAIGTTVEGRQQGQSTRTVERVKQMGRARICELCSVRTGNHAMHPLFDYEGSEGRQMILPANKKEGLPRRLAWVHSLCGFFINSFATTRGCVFPCDRQGKFTWGDCDDDEDENNMFVVNHFVISGRRYKEYYEVISALRAADSLNDCCQICRKYDGNSLRIPVECSTGNEDEYPRYKRCHSCNENCHVRMHIGCVAFRRTNGNGKQIIFHPRTSGRRGVICECYCKSHVADIEQIGKTNAGGGRTD